MIRSIEQGTSNTILRTKSDSITKVTPQIRKIARDMKATIKPAGGIGLAAPQVGENIRMILINIPSEHYDETGYGAYEFDTDLILINPTITWWSVEQCSLEEGCLSLPDFYADVVRPCAVEFHALTERGEDLSGKASGIFARVLQHEIDHLDGVLFEDRVEKRYKKNPHKIYI